MTLFVLFAVLMAALTLALLTRPFWLGRDKAPADPASVAGLKQQLEQLTALHRGGALGEAQFSEAKAALERRVTETAAQAPAARADGRLPASKALLGGMAGFVCVVAAAGYLVLGTPQALNPQALAAPADGSHNITLAQIEGMTQKLAARLKENPEDAEGWAMLGRSYAVLGRHDQAAPALKQAMTLRPDDAGVIADYADALAMVNGRNLEGEPSRLIAQALKVDPDNLKALSLAGTVAFYRKDYAAALRHWEKMAQLAPNSEFVQQIQGGIDEARKLSGDQPQATPTAKAAATPAAGTAVSGVVTLASTLASKAAPEDTLFVFARAAEGSRMPLAILRKQVKDLPLTFTLDDSMAMSPATRLSSAQRVVVGARVSKRGDATAQAGDLQGLSAPVAPGARGLKLEISEIVGP